jgi:hypothetical protein
MKIRTLSILALASLAATAACKKDGETSGESTATTTESTVVQGTDTVNQPTVVPTTDTVKTTTEVTTDTVHGDASATDTVKTDTTKKM